MQHLEDSLRRLKTDVIDLWQYHEVVYPGDPAMIFSDGGGIEAAYEAKKQGKVKHVGFTGHKDPDIFMEMLAHGYDWETVQMPINAFDAHFKSFEKRILPILRERDIGVIGMKSLGSGHLLRAKVIEPEEAIRYALSQQIDTLVSGVSSLDLLEKNVQIARGFQPMSDEEQQQLYATTKEPALTGEYEPFKTTRMFDGPIGRKLHGIA